VQPIAADVARPVCLSVCVFLLDVTMSCAKMAEPVEMPFGVCTEVGLGNHILDLARGRGNFGVGRFAAHCEVESFAAGSSIDVVCHCQYCSNLLDLF